MLVGLPITRVDDMSKKTSPYTQIMPAPIIMTATESTLSTLLHHHQESGDPIRGVALNSFLLMLSREQKSCAIKIQSGQKEGLVHLKAGTLIDAEYHNTSGLEAAYKILSWKDVSISMAESEQRTQQIADMLSRNLIKDNDAEQLAQETTAEPELTPPANPDSIADVAKVAVPPEAELEEIEKIEEEAPTINSANLTYTIAAAEQDPTYQKPLQILSGIESIQTFFLLNMSGKVAVHSAPSIDLGELIIYTIVACSKLKKTVEAKALKRIQMQMTDNTTLLILPVAGIIIGLFLEPETITDDVVSQIQLGLSQ